jgi:hypothetical protein
MPSPMSNNALADGYVIEVGGQLDSVYGTLTAALKAGLELKNKNSRARIKIYDAAERTPAPAGQSEISGRFA